VAARRGEHPGRTLHPVAEDTGLIVPLGYLVLQRACRQLAALVEENGHEATPWVSVNLSSRQLEDPVLADHVEGLLAFCGVPADRLVVEITERTAISDKAAVREALCALRFLGVRIAIDDFGRASPRSARPPTSRPTSSRSTGRSSRPS
jgi:EAL domain-containing protein (putative c-di-GMP-specific phosphodiesterase class I)